MSEDPRLVHTMAELLRAWAEDVAAIDEAAARLRQSGALAVNIGADMQDLARQALRDLDLVGLRLVHVANDLASAHPGGAA